nr:hypothetical protein [Oerskovia gallyi]
MSVADDASRLPAEQRARVLVDAQLQAAGWLVQDSKALNLFAGLGIAVREVVMAQGHGRVDYLLYVDKKVVGVIEAKPMGTALSGVEWQSAMYATGLPEAHRKRAVVVQDRLPFVFEASGSETHFTNGHDPDPRAGKIFNFPKPSTVARVLRRRRRPRASDVAGQGPGPAGTRRGTVAARADHGDHGHRAVPGAAAVRPLVDPDGDRRREDATGQTSPGSRLRLHDRSTSSSPSCSASSPTKSLHMEAST